MIKILQWLDKHFFEIGLFCLTLNFIAVCIGENITITALIANFIALLLFIAIYFKKYRIAIRNMEFYRMLCTEYNYTRIKDYFDKDTYGK